MAQKSQGLKKYAFSSAPQLKERNLLDLSSNDFQIRKQNTDSKGAISFHSKAASSSDVYVRRKRSGDSHTFPLHATQGTGERVTSYGKQGGASFGEQELNRRYFIVGERRISSYWWASVFFFGGLGFLITGISSYIKYNLFTSVYRAIEGFVNNGLAPSVQLADFFKTLGVVEPFHTLSVLLFSFGAQNLSSDPSEIGQNSQLLLSQPFLIQETGGESLIFFPQGLLLCFYGSLGLLLSLYWWLLIYWNVGGGFNEFNKKEGFMRIFRWGYPGKNRRIDIVYPLKDIEAIRVELNQTPGSGLLASEQTIFIRLLSTPQVLNKEPTLFGEKNSQIEVAKLEKEKLGEKRVSSSSISSSSAVKTGANRVLASSPTISPEAGKEVGKGAEKLKVKREIPLGGIGQPLTLKEIEKQASELANYLQVALEGL